MEEPGMGDEAAITVEALCVGIAGLRPDEVEHWVACRWVRADEADGRLLFREIDVARARLIHDLRRDMRIDDAALPMVLSLLDQLYAERRRLRRLRDALEQAAPDAVRRDVLARLSAV